MIVTKSLSFSSDRSYLFDSFIATAMSSAFVTTKLIRCSNENCSIIISANTHRESTDI